MAAFAWLAYRAVSASTTFPLPSGLHQRVVFDALGIWITASLGFRLLLSFVATEGLANVRMQTELSLARGIQATLVPTVSFQNSTFEVYGKSIPSAEMGGEARGPIPATAGSLLESADRVLPDLKEPDMYATLALLQFDGSAEAEYALAGHVPILHYRDRSRDTARLSMEQFPLGLIPGGCYASQRVMYSSGDLFLMLTDGISEVPNERDEEFGLARLEQLLTQYAAQPLPRIWELIMEQAHHHGLQQDDQTLLLIRVRH